MRSFLLVSYFPLSYLSFTFFYVSLYCIGSFTFLYFSLESPNNSKEKRLQALSFCFLLTLFNHFYISYSQSCIPNVSSLLASQINVACLSGFRERKKENEGEIGLQNGREKIVFFRSESGRLIAQRPRGRWRLKKESGQWWKEGSWRQKEASFDTLASTSSKEKRTKTRKGGCGAREKSESKHAIHSVLHSSVHSTHNFIRNNFLM